LKDTKTKEQFVNMRAEGKTYDAITKALNVSKTTLIAWGKELQIDIKNLKTVRLEAMYEQYNITKEARIKLVSEYIDKVRSEIGIRDMSNVSTDKLFDILLKLIEVQNKERDTLMFVKKDIYGSETHETWEAI
jgi:hypothetical protein